MVSMEFYGSGLCGKRHFYSPGWYSFFFPVAEVMDTPMKKVMDPEDPGTSGATALGVGMLLAVASALVSAFFVM